ncbi:unnamed protein product [Caenorhabditis bovis]|uniref:Receptor expression-enhancing protein n=1 Tax=Caenorhabditis bovis TaxID=2654633 RepID=A0A8S1ET54_9PELO|nr:unnamed protein product [Caenorhabditis bovis]
MSFIFRGLSSLIGTIIPCFYSFKALKKPTNVKLTQCVQYWSVYSAYLAIDYIVSTTFITCFIPFYDFLTFIFVLYIAIPQLGGASFVYKKILAPFLRKKERDFDKIISAVMTKAISYAPSFISSAVDMIKSLINSTSTAFIEYQDDVDIVPNRFRKTRIQNELRNRPATLPVIDIKPEIIDDEYELAMSRSNSRIVADLTDDELEISHMPSISESRFILDESGDGSDEERIENRLRSKRGRTSRSSVATPTIERAPSANIDSPPQEEPVRAKRGRPRRTSKKL